MSAVREISYLNYTGDALQPVEGAVIAEGRTCIYVNGKELVQLMCSPYQLDELALGFLRSEGIIQSLAEVEALTLSKNESCVDIWLHNRNFIVTGKLILTSGCGGGITFTDSETETQLLETELKILPAQITSLMKRLSQAAGLYQAARGVHISAISTVEELLLTAEDIGRHNTIDRLWGQALKQGLEVEGKILLTSGRVSSEMLGKAARMHIPLVISRTSPTSLSVNLAQQCNITLVGYARGEHFRVYTSPERICVQSVENLPQFSINLNIDRAEIS